MIYTVTFNPSLDYVLHVPHLKLGEVSRAEKEKLYPGGKGINVSIMLSHLGIENRALGFSAGFTGNEICRMLEESGCHTDFIPLPQGVSRINVKLKANEESDVNGQGPFIPWECVEQLLSKLDVLQENDVLILAGSIPHSLPPDIYQRILERLKDRKLKIVVDATGPLLQNVLRYHPFLIKPNNHELGELFGKELSSQEEILDCARQLRQQGAQNVLVSLAAQGAVLLSADGREICSAAPEGKARNSVGAGDSMVAGFLAGWLRTGDYQKALELGLAAGSASAFQDWLASKEQIAKLLKEPSAYGI